MCPLKNGTLKTVLSAVISLCYNDSAFQLKKTLAHYHLPIAQLVQVDTTICLEVQLAKTSLKILDIFFLLNLEIENRAESFQTLEHSKQRNVMNDK